MLDRWRFAIVLALLGFVSSAALIVHVMMSGYTDMDMRWGWAITVACPAHVLITQMFPYENSGTPLMMVLWVVQTALNAAIWFAVGALLTKLLGTR
jgi:hypothetical protein